MSFHRLLPSISFLKPDRRIAAGSPHPLGATWDGRGTNFALFSSTAEKVEHGHYSKTKVLTTFMAIMPADKPRYLLLIMLDEPQAAPDTHGFTTSGWNAVPVAGKVIARIAPILGLEPRFDLPPADKLILAAGKDAR